jgi:signal transduction histidine kinase
VTGTPCDVEELRTLFLFEKLDDRQLQWLCDRGQVETLPAGLVFSEGEPARCFYVLLDGEVALYRRVGDEDVEVTRTASRGVYAGAFQAYLGDRVPQIYTQSLRARVPSRFFVLSADDFAQLMQDWFPMAKHLLEGLFFGINNVNQVVGQRERLLALGSLSAGLTHELNNPAAAAVRATANLRENVAKSRTDWTAVIKAIKDKEILGRVLVRERDAVASLAATAKQRRKQHGLHAPKTTSALDDADREDELADWLSDRGVPDGWDVAATLVAAGIDTEWLDGLAGEVEPTALPTIIRWLSGTLEVQLLLDEIDDSTARISTLVKAAKQYSQMDRAPYQTVDVHEMLTSTLLMMSGSFGPGLTIVKDFDRSIPPISGYAGELNQVWTNLIDNAVSAMDGNGTLTLRTRREDDRVLVEIGDTGPGIPPELRERIFQPFFTTKPVGEGTGLGLDISWRVVVNRHHGDLTVTSEPGSTWFRVALPISTQEASGQQQSGEQPPGERPPGEQLSGVRLSAEQSPKEQV